MEKKGQGETSESVLKPFCPFGESSFYFTEYKYHQTYLSANTNCIRLLLTYFSELAYKKPTFGKEFIFR